MKEQRVVMKKQIKLVDGKLDQISRPEMMEADLEGARTGIQYS